MTTPLHDCITKPLTPWTPRDSFYNSIDRTDHRRGYMAAIFNNERVKGQTYLYGAGYDSGLEHLAEEKAAKAPEASKAVMFGALSVPREILENCQFFRDYPLPARSEVAA